MDLLDCAEAGVARAWRGEGDPESVITEVLLEDAQLIQSSLERLAGRPFDRQTAAEIVELHGHIARAISHKTHGVFLASFVSKYLHFHCPIVPIFDSNAQTAIGHYVDQKVYVLRTPVPADELDSAAVVTAYKNLKYVERDFRHIKADDLDLRPVFHRLEERVKAHVLICMLACYLTWHLRRA
jgi:transposase